MMLTLIQLVCSLLIVVIPILLIQYNLDISRIRKHIQENGWRKARVSPVAGNRKSLNESNKRFYRVVYLDADDKECVAICKASILNGISWEKE